MPWAATTRSAARYTAIDTSAVAELVERPTEVVTKPVTEDATMADTFKKLIAASANDATRQIAEARQRGEAHYRAAAEYKHREGQAIGLRESIVAALTARFGSVPAYLLARIDQAELEELRKMQSRVEVVGSLADFAVK